jgi:hypothetical protein
MVNSLSVINCQKSLNGYQISAIRYQESSESAGFNASLLGVRRLAAAFQA